MQLTHHAHLLRASLPDSVHVPLAPETERHDRFFARFGIDDARSLIDQAHVRPREASEQVFVIRTDFITHEAQNALLKVLEEPPVTTRFLFVVPFDCSLLPTLASRMQLLQQFDEDVDNSAFAAFLSQSFKDRLTAIDAAQKKKDVAWQRSIKTGLVDYLKSAEEVKRYQELEFVARMLLTRGASNKMLLEHAALLL